MFPSSPCQDSDRSSLPSASALSAAEEAETSAAEETASEETPIEQTLEGLTTNCYSQTESEQSPSLSPVPVLELASQYPIEGVSDSSALEATTEHAPASVSEAHRAAPPPPPRCRSIIIPSPATGVAEGIASFATGPLLSPPMERRRSALPVPGSARPSRPVSVVSSVGDDSSSDEDSGYDNNDESTNSEKAAERARRTKERERVLEAAGLRLTTSAASHRRPPPSVPARRPLSTVSTLSDAAPSTGRSERPLPSLPSAGRQQPGDVEEEEEEVEEKARSLSPEPVLEDAYDRYEAFLEQQRQAPPPTAIKLERHSSTSSGDKLNGISSPTSAGVLSNPTTTVGGGHHGSGGGRMSAYISKVKSQASAYISPATPEPKRPSIVIGGPMSGGPIGGLVPGAAAGPDDTARVSTSVMGSVSLCLP